MCRSREKRPFGNSLDVSEPKLGPLNEVLPRQRLSVVDDAVRGWRRLNGSSRRRSPGDDLVDVEDKSN